MTWKLSSGDEWSEQTRKYVHTESSNVWIRWREEKNNQRYVSLFCSLSVYFVKQRTQLNESTHYKTENKTATTNHLHITHSPFSFISTFSYYTIPYYTDTREFVAVSLFFEYICCFLFATEFITLRRSLFVLCVCIWQTIEWNDLKCLVLVQSWRRMAITTFNYSFYRMWSKDNCHLFSYLVDSIASVLIIPIICD